MNAQDERGRATPSGVKKAKEIETAILEQISPWTRILGQMNARAQVTVEEENER